MDWFPKIHLRQRLDVKNGRIERPGSHGNLQYQVAVAGRTLK